MLSSLHLINFVIVSQSELPLNAGMTAITGETGAGKSILIDALNLVLGGRISNDVVRHGKEQAEIITSFDLSDCPDAINWLNEQELYSDQECILRRIIRLQGPSRGFINGRPATMQQLRQLGDLLVDIHGQHEHQSLLRPDDQRKILDAIAEQQTSQKKSHQASLNKLAEHFKELQQLQTSLDELQKLDGTDNTHIELLRYQANELEQLDLQINEIEELEEEHRKLANASDLITGINENLASLSDENQTAIEQDLGQIIISMQHLERFDPALSEINQLLVNASIQIDEASNRLRQYLEQMDSNPERLDWINQRMGMIHDLARKHRINPSELTAQLASLQQQLENLESAEIRIEELNQKLSSCLLDYRRQAKIVSTQRKQTAKKLSADVSERMQTLGMEGGIFTISVSDAESDIPKRHGLDKIEYRVAANPGQSPQPLNKVASGGELSRIALALQVGVMESSTTPTLIFDEIDVGIGGRVAEIVGQQLAKLGTIRQVLCITHLAQVAAKAHHQILISKSGDPVEASVASLQDKQRVEEIARMMGGIEITEQTRAHAEELLSQEKA